METSAIALIPALTERMPEVVTQGARSITTEPRPLTIPVFTPKRNVLPSGSDDLIVWRKRKQPSLPLRHRECSWKVFAIPVSGRKPEKMAHDLGSGLTDVGGAVLIYRSKT
jgi:hypothetical protein